MWLRGPSSARAGDTVTVTAGGLADGVEQVKFDADGNVGWDIVAVSGGSASFRLKLDFAGTTAITAQGQDKFGSDVGGSARHSIAVKDDSFEGAPSTETPELICDAAAPVGGVWSATLAGLEAAHSVIVEFYGANGGLLRLFPRGRSTMNLTRVFDAPGETAVIATVRDARMQPIVVHEARFFVSGNEMASSNAATRSPAPRAQSRPLSRAPAPMGVVKPPVARSAGDAVVGRLGPSDLARRQPLRGMDGPTTAEVGETIRVAFSTPLEAVQVHFSASNGEIRSTTPQSVVGGEQAITAAAGASAGSMVISAKAFDASGALAHEAVHVVQVREGPSRRSGDVAESMQRAIENRLRNRLHRNDKP
jgi:hypothetical protein